MTRRKDPATALQVADVMIAAVDAMSVVSITIQSARADTSALAIVYDKGTGAFTVIGPRGEMTAAQPRRRSPAPKKDTP